MGIPVEVPGLDSIIPQLDEGKLVVVESGPDSAKSFFVRRLTLSAVKRGWRATFVTSRDREELYGLFSSEGGLLPGLGGHLELIERDQVKSLDEYGAEGGLLAVDSFSFLTIDLQAAAMAALLRSLHAVCREKRTTVLLATDRGMFDPRSEAVTTHLSDGFIEFHAKEGTEGIVRFLRIPKWMDGKFVDRNIYYEFDGKRLAIDLRSRVL